MNIQPIPPPLRYRNKCKILASIDLLWRLCELFYPAVTTFYPEMIFVSENAKLHWRIFPENQDVWSYNVIKVIDPRVYDFLLFPFLQLIYFLGFFLQVSSSIFLCRSCSEKSLPENERAACKIWCRIAVVSVFIICIRFLLPYIILSVLNFTYNAVRVLFKVFGIYTTMKHAREMEPLLLQFGNQPHRNYSRSRIDSTRHAATSSRDEGRPISLQNETRKSILATVSSRESEETINDSFARPPVYRAMLHMEKEMYEKALNELKIAQSYSPNDSNVITLINIVEKIVKITNEPRKDYYKILGVSKSLSPEEIKRAYRRKSLRHHPDKHFTASDEVKTKQTKVYQEIREAYDIISDPVKRPIYDEELQRQKEVLIKYRKMFKGVYDSFESPKYFSSTV